MDSLFSCRNCIHNPGQTLLIGRGDGFCLMHQSVLRRADQTTCKHLYRKDLPSFTVDEGVKEHAFEFALYPSIVDMTTMNRVERIAYSERHAWLTRTFDNLEQNLALSRKIETSWVFVQSLAGGSDGRRALAHSSMVRRYMARCGTWRSSYRLVLALIQDLSRTPRFEASDLLPGTSDEALWDVFFTRISGIQEYGFLAGLEPLWWATDELGDALIDLDWDVLKPELQQRAHTWTSLIIAHAQNDGAFFPGREEDSFNDADAMF